MTKLCPRGKAAAKRKFRVYPSAYANAYASKICAGKIKDPSGVKRKDFRGSKAAGGIIEKLKKTDPDKKKRKEGILPKLQEFKSKEDKKKKRLEDLRKELGMKDGGMMRTKETLRRIGKVITPGAVKTIRKFVKESKAKQQDKARVKKMGGGLMEATARLKRQGLRGGGLCKRGMNREAIGKNS